MDVVRAIVAVLLVAIAAPIAASAFAFVREALAYTAMGISGAVILLVFLLAVGHGLYRRSRARTSYW